MSNKVGIKAIQSILKKATQSNLSFFHHVGSASDSVLPKPSIAEVLDYSKNAISSSTVDIKDGMHVGLRKNILYNEFGDFVISYVFSAICVFDEWEDIWKTNTNDGRIFVRFYMDVAKLASLGITCMFIATRMFEQNFPFDVSPEFIGMIDVYIENESYVPVLLALMSERIYGFKNIQRAIVVDTGNDKYVLETIGTSISAMLYISNCIDFETLTVNNIEEAYEYFGIEAARELIRTLLGDDNGNIIADFMTRSGEVYAIDRGSIKRYERGYASYAFFERVKNGLQEIDDPIIDPMASIYSRLLKGLP